MSKEIFDEISGNYDEQLARGIMLSGESKDYSAARRVEITKSVISRLGTIPQAFIDFGCGTGSSIPHLRSTIGSGNIIGLDTSAKSLEIARKPWGQQ